MSSLVRSSQSPLIEAESGQSPLSVVSASEQRNPTNPLAVAWRSRWLLLLCMMIGAGCGWIALQKVTPQYTSVSRVFVERTLPRLLDQDVQMTQSATYLYTQAELIRSTAVLAAAAESLESENLETFQDLDNPVALLKESIQTTVGKYDDIINVWAELPNAKDASKIVNAVVSSYITKYAEQRRTNTVEVLKILRNEKERRDAELEERTKALDAFRRAHAALAVQVNEESVVTQRFASLSDELNRTEIELLQAKAKYNRVKKMFETPSQHTFLLEIASAESQAHRDMDIEGQVRSYEQTLTAERARWGEGHPRVRLLRESLDEMRKSVAKQQEAIVTAYVDEVRQKYELLDHKRTELQRAYDDQFKMASEVNAQTLQLQSLREAVSRTAKLCDILDERMKEVNLTEEVGAMNVTIMEPASRPSLPSYPSRARFLAIGVLLGGLSGFGLAWLRDLLDHRLKSVDDIASALQLPVLGAIPLLTANKGRVESGKMVLLAPRSAGAESIRTLRTALHFGLAGHDAKTIVVTSPSAGDGKSTIASNLAIAMAQANQRVLLLDADMRKPMQHVIFQTPTECGLSTALASRLPVEDAVIHTELGSLDILPCGPLPVNPAELLNNGYFAELLEQLKARYDKIIIDSPPVMPVADARVIAAMSDAAILVLRAERSTRRLSIGARNELWKVRAQRLGVVVNGVPNRKQGAYGYGYGYGDSGGGYISEEPLPAQRRKKSRALPTPADPVEVGAIETNEPNVEL